MVKEKRGDWSVPLRIMPEHEARSYTHGIPDKPGERDAKEFRKQVDAEKALPHPAKNAHKDDDES